MTKFNPKDHLMKMSGKDYLEVKWRQVWFREDHPKGGIITELVNSDPVVMFSTIKNEDGLVLGTGHGTPKKQGKAANRPFEGAETAAIGRALANAGYGTQFTGEEEGEHLSDSPVENKATRQWTAAQMGWLVEANHAQDTEEAKAMLDKSTLPGNAKKAIILSWGKYYRAAMDEGKTSFESAQIANDKYAKRGK